MRQLQHCHHPIAHRVLVCLHLLVQLGLLGAAALWLVPRTPWLAAVEWSQAWPSLALGTGLWLAAALGLRLVIELCQQAVQRKERKGFAPHEMVTRSFERRPAVHDAQAAWTSEARAIEIEPSVLGSARVTRPAEPLKPQESA
ncbi:MAG: hypothetical protein JJU25_01995 [Halomonas sp.]|nr:hypothetical protein [Halomonas sp.]MCC5881397.1 hypothetical protein [Halomonas sp.]